MSSIQRRELRGGDVARARRIEDEAERACAGLDRGQRVFAIGDAADLDEHQATSSRSARAGSPDFTRCSPTRNAS